MTFEKAKEIICDAIFNGEYRATEEQEEAYFTIFHEGLKEPINEEELDELLMQLLICAQQGYTQCASDDVVIRNMKKILKAKEEHQ